MLISKAQAPPSDYLSEDLEPGEVVQHVHRLDQHTVLVVCVMHNRSSLPLVDDEVCLAGYI